MKSLLLILSFFILSCSHFKGNGSISKISILQGVTTQKEVEFSIMCERNEDLRFELRNEDDEVHAPNNIKVHERDFSPFAIYKVAFSKEVAKEYNLVIYLGSKIIDQRLIGKGQRESTKLKLAVVSSVDDFEKDQSIWEKILMENPEYLLFVGNTVPLEKTDSEEYAVTNPRILWDRNVELRKKLPLFFQQKLIPTHAIWDDRDFGVRHGNASFTYKDESMEVFNAFWGQELIEEGWTKGPGVSGVLNQGDFNLYFLDGRSFRSEDQGETHLGTLQQNWLLTKLKEEETPSLIIKGDPFFGIHKSYQSFEGNHPKDFENFVQELKKISTPFIFVSGDKHLSEIMQFPRSLFGKPSFELTAGPLNGPMTPEEFDNPWRVIKNDRHQSFTLLENSSEDNHWFIDVKNIGKDGKIYYQRDLAVFIKDLQNNLNQIRKRRSIKQRSYKFKPINKRKRR